MKNVLFLMILVMITLGFLSEYATKQGEEVKISLKNISTDKIVYHSSEVLNLTAMIYSNSNIENVTVKINGINGRLNEKRILNLNNGINEVSFTYVLPRCNVCGGIMAGNYDLGCEVIYKDITIENFTTINIQQ